MLGLMLSLSGFAFVAGAPARVPVIFLDRFGNTYIHSNPTEAKMIPAAIGKSVPQSEIVIVYDPLSIKSDRSNLQAFLKVQFPKSSVVVRKAGEGDFVSLRLHPSDKSLQRRLLANKNGLLQQLTLKRTEIVRGLQDYILQLAHRLSGLRKEVGEIQSEYRKLTIQHKHAEAEHE